MEYNNYTIFRDWFTLFYDNKKLQLKYMIDNYSFKRMALTLGCYCVVAIILMGINLYKMFNESDFPYNLGELMLITVIGLISIANMMLLMLFKNKSWFFNLLDSVLMNFCQFLIFEAIKILTWKSSANKDGTFGIDIAGFATKAVWLLLVDYTFLYNMITFLLFIPFYASIFIKKYEGPENETGFFIIVHFFLVIGLYFIERIFKMNYFSKFMNQREIERNQNMVDNMKSGFCQFNITTNKVIVNKVFTEKFLPKLLVGVTYSERIMGMSNFSLQSQPLKEKDDKRTSEDKRKECNLIKNLLFTRLDKVTTIEFDGHMRKATEDINMKLHANTTKLTKNVFFKSETMEKSTSKNKQNIGLVEEIPIKETGFNLLDDPEFKDIIELCLKYNQEIIEFKYFGNKRIKTEINEEFNCTIFIRYHEYTNSLEFIISEVTQPSMKSIYSMGRALAKKSQGNTEDNDNSSDNLISVINNRNASNGGAIKKTIANYLNKANINIKYPLKEISIKASEGLELINSNYEDSQEDIRDLLTYVENLSQIANYSLEDLKYVSKGKRTIGSIDKERGDLGELLDDVMSIAKAKVRLKSRNITLSCDIGPGVDDIVITDLKKLKHILIILLLNSIQASGEGNIHVQVDKKARRKDTLEFTVFDEGTGIRKDIMDYYNNHTPAEMDKISGLVIAKALSEAIGSEIVLSSNNPNGTKASFTLKLYDEEDIKDEIQITTDVSDAAEKEDIAMDLSSRPLKDRKDGVTNDKRTTVISNLTNLARKDIMVDDCDFRIILTDDDKDQREVWRNLLLHHAKVIGKKFDIIECKDGAEAVFALYTAFDANKFVDCMFFDDNMKFIHGMVLVEILNVLFKRNVIPLDIYVMMATEFTHSIDQFKFLTLVSKPIDYASLKKAFINVKTLGGETPIN